jgi:hypothetical protein
VSHFKNQWRHLVNIPFGVICSDNFSIYSALVEHCAVNSFVEPFVVPLPGGFDAPLLVESLNTVESLSGRPSRLRVAIQPNSFASIATAHRFLSVMGRIPCAGRWAGGRVGGCIGLWIVQPGAACAGRGVAASMRRLSSRTVRRGTDSSGRGRLRAAQGGADYGFGRSSGDDGHPGVGYTARDGADSLPRTP